MGMAYALLCSGRSPGKCGFSGHHSRPTEGAAEGHQHAAYRGLSQLSGAVTVGT